jgi:hypothetical protein
MSGLCLEAGATVLRLALASFTLAWTHTVEKVAWEEDWRVEPAGLVLVESRVRGSGAGMEPGPDARLEGGVFRWRPSLPPLSQVILARTPGLADWRICAEGSCSPLGSLLPASEGPVTLRPCMPPQETGSNQSGVL